MRKHLLLVMFLWFAHFALCQNVSPDNLLLTSCQVSLSGNTLLYTEPGIRTKPGIGLSFLRLWRENKHFQVLAGLSYQRVLFHSQYVSTSHFSYVKDVDFRQTTLSIPVFFRYALGKSNLKFFVEAGPSFDLILALNGKGTAIWYPPGLSPGEKEVWQSFDHDDFLTIGANLGIGALFPFRTGTMVVSSNFHNRLIDGKRLNFYNFNEPLDVESCNRYLTLNLGLIVHLSAVKRQ